MIMVPIEPERRDAVIADFLEDRQHGRTTVFDGDDLLGQLRKLGDVRRLEWLAQMLKQQELR